MSKLRSNAAKKKNEREGDMRYFLVGVKLTLSKVYRVPSGNGGAEGDEGKMSHPGCEKVQRTKYELGKIYVEVR